MNKKEKSEKLTEAVTELIWLQRGEKYSVAGNELIEKVSKLIIEVRDSEDNERKELKQELLQVIESH